MSDELPPSAVTRLAELCAWCGKSYAAHLDSRPADAPVPRMPCAGLKAFFLKEEEAPMATENAEAQLDKAQMTGEVELRISGKVVEQPDDVEAALKLDDKAAVRARRSLSRFIEDMERAAEEAWDEGRSGYIGRIKFCAFELRISGKVVEQPDDVEAALKLDDKAAVRARRSLSQFIEDMERAAEEAWDEGRSGYIGRIKFCAFVDDDGVHLRVEQSMTEEV